MRLTGGKEFALLRPGPVVNHAFAVILSLAPGYLRPTRTGLLVSTPSGWPNLRRKGAQSLNALIGLWLGYSGIFANPPANINNVLLAPPSPSWGWCSTRWVTGAASLVCFRNILLVGMLTATAAMWSMLHRWLPRDPAEGAE
jgi:hypothetical protein